MLALPAFQAALARRRRQAVRGGDQQRHAVAVDQRGRTARTP
ncbi:hypothetical protein ACPA9J_03625 [Pseudomonas aeruginosa]